MNGIGRMAKAVWNRIGTERQLGQLAEQAAADFGVPPADLHAAARQKGDEADRMDRMAAVFGAEAGLRAANRYQRLDMARACTCCTDRATCADLLHGEGPVTPEAAAFCPNAAEYRAMADGPKVA